MDIARPTGALIVLAMLLVAAGNTVGYALTSYMPTYLTADHGL